MLTFSNLFDDQEGLTSYPSFRRRSKKPKTTTGNEAFGENTGGGADNAENGTAKNDDVEDTSKKVSVWVRIARKCHRKTFVGAVFCNFWAFFFPALHVILSKLLVGHIDPNQVATTKLYTWMSVAGLVLNDGLPRAAWTVIGDDTTRSRHSRISLSYTLILFQVVFGIAVSGILMASAERNAVSPSATVSGGMSKTSLAYVRYDAMSALTSAIEIGVFNSARALDHPEIPMLVNFVKFSLNMILDVTVMSQYGTLVHQPSMINQAAINMTCDLASAALGLWYFKRVTTKYTKERTTATTGPNGWKAIDKSKARPCYASLKVLFQHGIWTFIESAIRNLILVYLMIGLTTALKTENATAWNAFRDIRLGMLLVPLQALETSTLTFVGHAWGEWRKEVGPTETQVEVKESEKDKLTKFYAITKPAWLPCLMIPPLETVLFIVLSIWWAKPYALFMSGDQSTAAMVQWMWRTIDWCWIPAALSTILATILLATTPRYFCLQGAITGLLWMLPWAVGVPGYNYTAARAWHFAAVLFGGEKLVSFCSVVFTCWLWRRLLFRGKVKLLPVMKEVDESIPASDKP
ncbi:hypothetical protein LSUE1_G003878 [Lachnellula suecica]|uniref:Uncharacterized protein n=1 Tax=Lachnellula suecica TaxID=602035 RepID=A0A8T9CAA5_9HELO|nr:hypothetical protein LSUE1_G003878 [Lachnellula suecica]